MLDLAEVHRIEIAWGAVPIPVALGDVWSKGERDQDLCRWPRADGFACWGDTGGEDVCHRHAEALDVEIRQTCTGLNAIYRAVDAKPKRRGVYFITAADLVKIGRADDVKIRMQTLQCGSPISLHLRRFVTATDSLALERWLHKRYAAHRRHGEWFSAAPVLADAEQHTDDWLRDRAGTALPLTGPARTIARFFGTHEGRFAGANLDLRVEFTA